MSYHDLLQRLKATLDCSGVVGFFGDETATTALFRRTVYEGGRIAGWYNTPGSFHLSKHLSRLSKSRIASGPQGPILDPAVISDVGAPEGPAYRAALSGTYMSRTGRVARIFEEECAELKPEQVEGRRTTPVGVTIVELGEPVAAVTHPTLNRKGAALLSLIPIAASLGASYLAFATRDWFAGSIILLGIVTSGISSIALQYARFTFDHPIAAPGAPAGDGIFVGDREVIIVKGHEDAVNAITRGRFTLRFESELGPTLLKASSLLYTLQFLLQLVIIPQSTFNGQLLFIASIAVSWAYSAYLTSLDNGKIQRRILIESVLNKPTMRKYALGTRTTMVVFALLAMRPLNPEKHLEELLPNDTKVWRIWRDSLLKKIRNGQTLRFRSEAADKSDLTDAEFSLLKTLYGDAEAAQAAYELEVSCSHK